MLVLVFDTGSCPAGGSCFRHAASADCGTHGTLPRPWHYHSSLFGGKRLIRSQGYTLLSGHCKELKKNKTLRLPLLHLGQALVAAYSAETDSKLRSQRVFVCWRHRFFCQMLYLKSLRLRFRNVATQCYIILAFTGACFNPTCQIPPKIPAFCSHSHLGNGPQKKFGKRGKALKKTFGRCLDEPSVSHIQKCTAQISHCLPDSN